MLREASIDLAQRFDAVSVVGRSKSRLESLKNSCARIHPLAVDYTDQEKLCAEIDRAARANASAAPSSEALIASWKAGKGRLVATKTIVTRPGINAQIQTVEEIIYPTEFSAAPAGGTNAPTTTMPVATTPT